MAGRSGEEGRKERKRDWLQPAQLPLIHVYGRGEGKKGDGRDREHRLGDFFPCSGAALQSTLDRPWSSISPLSPPRKPEACKLVRRGIK